jgi:predicted O-methyltransferase YrrM
VDPVARVRWERNRLAFQGPWEGRGGGPAFATVSLPRHDGDLLRDLLVAEGARTVVEVGLAYGSSALAIGEALLTVGARDPRHIVIDPWQAGPFANQGWELLCASGLEGVAQLIEAPASLALARLFTDGLVADAAFVDGSHRFHEVFVDLYWLRKIVRPGGLVVLDDDWAPSVRAAVRYYEQNLGWVEVPGAFAGGTHETVRHDPAGEAVPRCRALRLPDPSFEPPFEDFRPFPT